MKMIVLHAEEILNMHYCLVFQLVLLKMNGVKHGLRLSI